MAGVLVSENLHKFRLSQMNSLYYIPDYLSKDQEQVVTDQILARQTKWIQLSGRRLQNYGINLQAAGRVSTANLNVHICIRFVHDLDCN